MDYFQQGAGVAEAVKSLNPESLAGRLMGRSWMETSREIPLDDDWRGHAAALRRLARALCGDEHEADDLVQEAWMRSGRLPDGANRRSWLRTILRNLVRDQARGRDRRAAGEFSAARAEALPSGGEIVERLEVAERVAREVARLPEPYRTAIHLRYFEGLAPDEIARRAVLPVETVRTRLRRGLELLRERMDKASDGGRNAWLSALAPIALRTDPAVTLTAGTSLAAVGGAVMSAKALLSVAAAAAVVFVVYLAWPTAEDASRPSPPPVQAAASELESPPKIAEAPAPVPAIETDRSEATQPRETAAAVPEPDVGTIEMHGTVVVVDEQGVEHRNEDGVLRVASGSNERDVRFVEVRVEHGSWSTRVPASGLFGIGELVAGGRRVRIPEDRPIHPGPEPIEVRGEWLKRGRLRVVDAASKQDLRGVEVRCARGWRANPESSHPGDSELVGTVLQGVDSPFDLPERLRPTPYWVHAEGHAWARVDFDHRLGGERTVELVAPGSVEVSIANGPVPQGAFVRFYPTNRPTPSWLASVSVRVSSDGVTRIEDFEPGSYFACVELGEYDATKRLGETPVEVRAGERSNVTIPLGAPGPEEPTVHLFGTLILPAGFETFGATLRLWREGGGAKSETFQIHDLPTVGEGDRVRRWDMGAVPTGTWGAAIVPVLHRQLILAEQPGELSVEIRVPELVTLSIEVVDAASGDPIDPTDIGWSDGKVAGLASGFRAPVASAGAKGRHRLTAPEGAIRISCSAPGYGDFYETLELHGRESSLRIELRRACGLVVQLFENDARVRADFSFWNEVRAIPDGGRIPTGKPGRSTELEKILQFDEPGRYRLTFPALEGFEPIEAMVVDVPPQKTIDVRVPVRRK